MLTLNFQEAVQRIKTGEDARETALKVLNQLSTDERLSLLQGHDTFWKGLASLFGGGYDNRPQPFGPIPRIDYPGVLFCDGPRGCVIGKSTAFPVPMARGATWDIDLERRVGHAIGLEARAMGANHVGSVCINLPRHPAWGRVQESYSEDPYHLGEFAAAHIQGLQRNAMACVKHFALNSMEIARFQVDITVDDETLHEVYLPHFRRAVEAGAYSIMSAYNSVNKQWAGESKQLLTHILRDVWKFDGFVITDWVFGVRDAVQGIINGLDIEAPFRNDLARNLPKALADGKISLTDTNRAGLNILSTALRHYATRDENQPTRDVLCNKKHRTLAREVASRSIVLLKNEEICGQPLLPLSTTVSNVAVIGRLANSHHTGDDGSSLVKSDRIISPFEGFCAALGNDKVTLNDSDNVKEAEEAALKADVVVVVVGYAAGDEGEHLVPSFEVNPELQNFLPPPDEYDTSLDQMAKIVGPKPGKAGFEGRVHGGDRRSLRLRDQDVQIIQAVIKKNPRTIVSIITAGAVIVEEWEHAAPAIMVGWYNGVEGGTALADVILGHVNPSGRLPWSMPKHEDHLPYFDINAKSMTYDRWYGQKLLDKLGVEARHPLGFGLSYTTFTLSDVSVEEVAADSERLSVSAKATNTGSMVGRCIIQIYGRPIVVAEGFEPRCLLGFAPVDLEAGQSSTIAIPCSTRPLQKWRNGRFVLTASDFVIEVSQHCGDPSAVIIEKTLIKLENP